MLNLDTLIFSTFLIINILVGLFHSRGVVNIQQYAIGERNFSTSTLVATIVATWLGVEFLNYDLSETYSHGLYFMLPSFGDAISIFLVGAFFAKRMGEFLGKLSIAEAMGDLFGRRVQFITAVMGVFLSIGYLAIQFKMSAKVLEMLFGSSAIYSTLISAIIVVVYSTLGGIRSVAFTDVIQLLTFGLIIPIIVITVWHKSDASVVHTFQTNSNFDFKEIFDLTNPRFYEMLILAGFFFTPSFQPAMFQRISMASSTQQAAQSFRISSFVCLIIKLLVMFLGVVILSENPNLDPEKLMNYVTNHYTYIGFKGLFATAIMAVVMSTADSLINTIGVIFANDLLKPSGLKFMGSELKTSKIFAFTSAMIAILFALKFHSILELILMFAGSYMAIVSIPFILAILGFRSSETSVLIAMTGAATTFIIWQNKLFGITSNIDSCGPAIIASIIFLFAGHYLLRQPGGWTGIKDKIGFENHKKMQQKKRQEFINSIFGFSFNEFFQKNLPLNENTYPLIGFTSAGIIITNILFVPLHVHENNSKMLVIISGITWTIASYFAIFPILPESFKKHKIAAFLWTFGVTIAFVCSPFIFLILSDFEAIQSIILAINIIAVLFLFNWSVSLFLIALGTYSSSLLLQDYLVMEHDLQILITIAFLMLGLILATFAQPKEKAYKSKEKLYNKLDIEKADMSQKIQELIILKQEILNNLSHEIRTPIHHIGSGAEAIYKDWDKYTPKQIREFAEMIYIGYQNATKYIDSLLDLSDLSSNKVNLNLVQTNFVSIVENSVEEFKELYLQSSNLQVNICSNESHLKVTCDEDKIKKVITSLLENAVQYGQESLIEIIIDKSQRTNSRKFAKFIIRDFGIGIPEDELVHIFEPFAQSSSTKKMSGGRGIGLALCEQIIVMHQGKIWAENNVGKPGSMFSFMLPLDLSA